LLTTTVHSQSAALQDRFPPVLFLSNPEYPRGLHKDCIGWILNPAAWRADHVARATINGVSERDILLQTRHKSAEMLAKCVSGG
jgi:hypothetical protein